MNSELTERLARALAAKGAGYRPRTHHMNGAQPRYTNRLILETSPYLLQHAHNPVNWRPWGDDAFAAARAEGKPVFLSIGYATCHWCHVMEGESFEDEEIAAYLNKHYVCIKVDREERPDVDAVYMAAVQAQTGGGGWPLSAWLTSERKPFFTGTYFPPRDGARGARKGFLTLLGELRDVFDREPVKIAQAAGSLADAVRESLEGARPPGAESELPGTAAIKATVAYFKRAFDNVNGGLARAPKFPSNVPVRLLLRHHRRTGDQDALHMASLTLQKMAAGGMYDQVGGGFHRYSTDAEWLVPHFEKMLYDNALLAVAYAEAHQVTGRADFARVAREVLDYVLREMTSPEGPFFSATDADSEGPDGKSEEGKFFVWSDDEIREVLGDRADRFINHYGVTPGGNFEGANILNVATPDEAAWAELADARGALYDVRARRPPPLLDDKIIAAWNGLAISALAVCGRILNEPRYVAAAARASEGILRLMRTPGDARVARTWKDGRRGVTGFLEDQVFVTAGLLDLFEATGDVRWLQEAVALADAVEAHHADVDGGGWFSSAKDAEKLLAREKPDYDGAEPSGTSVAILNVLRLSAFTGDDRWRQIAVRALGSVREVLAQRGPAMTEALVALDFFTDDVREVAIVWPAGARAQAEPLLDVLRTTFLPGHVLAAIDETQVEATARVATFVEGKVSMEGKPTAYVCTHGTCKAPTTDPQVLRAALAGVKAS